MIGKGERAYAYAKACGIIGKSFVGKRIEELAPLTRLSELDRLVFPEDPHNLPEKELIRDLEKRFIERYRESVLKIIQCYEKLPRFFTLLVQIRDPKSVSEGQNDQEYYTALWESMLELPKKDRRFIQRALHDEIMLRNAVWALRLRSYYNMKDDEIRRHLVSPWTGDAEFCLSHPLDNRQAWTSWHWAKFLNPPEELWTPDPRYFQNAVAEYLYHLAYRNFRSSLFSLETVFSYIKIKQFEEDLLTSISGGISLGMPARDVMALLEAA
jgi:hypothetical protein